MADSSRAVAIGRPKCDIDRERLQQLRSLKFKWKEIAALIGTSSKTVQRRAKEWNIQLP